MLRLLRAIAVAGRRAKCDLSVCGEMAADPLLVALLVGLGFRTFSMTPAAIPIVKRGLAALDRRQAADAARRRAARADRSTTSTPCWRRWPTPCIEPPWTDPRHVNRK